MRVASKIFSDFKDRYHYSMIVKLVQDATSGNHSPWRGAGKMVNQVVWQTIVKDCIIPQQSVWLTTVQDKLSHGKADQGDLMTLAKAIDSCLVSVEGLHRASTASEGIHCEVLTVIEVDSDLLKTLLRDMALQLVKGRPSGRVDLEPFQDVVRKTLAKLRWILPKYPENDMAITLIREWDHQKLDSSTLERDSSSVATLASSVSGESLPALAGVSPSVSSALTGKSGGESQSGSVPGSNSAATYSHGRLSLAGGDSHSLRQFTQSLGALLKGRRRTRDTAEDRFAMEPKAQRKVLGHHSAPSDLDLNASDAGDRSDTESVNTVSSGSSAGDSIFSGVSHNTSRSSSIDLGLGC
jgi:hypothetical protein